MLNELMYFKDARAKRISSWDRSGKNRDFQVLVPGERRTLAKIRSLAKIGHIWMTK